MDIKKIATELVKDGPLMDATLTADGNIEVRGDNVVLVIGCDEDEDGEVEGFTYSEYSLPEYYTEGRRSSHINTDWWVAVGNPENEIREFLTAWGAENISKES